MRGQLHAFDTALTQVVGRIPAAVQPYFVWLGRFTTPVLWVSLFTLVHVAWLTPGRLHQAALGIVLLMPLASLMKLFFRRRRPPTIYAEAMRVKSYSFPSSHAYSSVLAVGYMAGEAGQAGLQLTAVALGLLPFIIGISRVHVGAHYPSDVIAGWGLGGAMLTLVLVGL